MDNFSQLTTWLRSKSIEHSVRCQIRHNGGDPTSELRFTAKQIGATNAINTITAIENLAENSAHWAKVASKAQCAKNKGQIKLRRKLMRITFGNRPVIARADNRNSQCARMW